MNSMLIMIFGLVLFGLCLLVGYNLYKIQIENIEHHRKTTFNRNAHIIKTTQELLGGSEFNSL